MQIIKTWPDQLTLPQNVKTALLKHLPEALQKLSEAKFYWQSSGTILRFFYQKIAIHHIGYFDFTIFKILIHKNSINELIFPEGE
ncbi:hypothetical protein BPLS_P5519 [Bathymodiolus platifrons methanotrophic gill symbiont]|uniref:hypothetical protein n=1 Tax=Bathymodiolus platifrons methanotrophic gill symbiont TaxID=113268 RepID=UPI000B41E76E|nr:hypothetical protein [Bathymodiolus platifrons methanotrophic gill symbiont]GFO77209.1 hypothetical protein BPLS_P5519 [Bathymodiolus platifrons methanotrophic gill symbiont]